jgi:hypothetical protein
MVFGYAAFGIRHLGMGMGIWLCGIYDICHAAFMAIYGI